MRYALILRVIQEEEAARLEGSGCDALMKSSAAQAVSQAETDPVKQYFNALKAALSNGRAFIERLDRGRPEERKIEDEESWKQNVKPGLIGWQVGADLYLQPDAAYAEARKMAHDTGEDIKLGQAALTRLFNERGLLSSTEPKRGTLRVRRKLDGAHHNVLHLAASVLEDLEPEEVIGEQIFGG